MATNVPVTLDTLIVVKVLFQGHSKKFKIPLRDLGANVLPEKLRTLLQVQPEDEVVFERYSDSAGAYVTLDSNKPQVYKTLFRAAKAKLKLRLRATLVGEEPEAPQDPVPVVFENEAPRPRSLYRMSTDTLSPAGATQVSPVMAHSPIPPAPLSTLVPEPEVAQVSPVSPLVPHKADTEGEAPSPPVFTARQSFFGGLAAASHNADLAFRPKENPQTSWVVFCNNCNQAMEDVHYHCSICDNGDYDLCPSCIDAGFHCPSTGHWMVKRFVKYGAVINSTTERIAPKTQPKAEKEMPGAFEQPVMYEAEEPTRTCNCCVKVLPEKEFVTCTVCDDYDLCLECHVNNKHGHHPGHAFKAATPETVLPALANFLCNSGRNVRHSAVCDGCDKFIYGVRHKCLNCPDWDFCSECIKNAKFIHPRHRFVPIYEPLAEPVSTGARHYGIYCDGPLCKDKENLSYIEGVRYKCAVCHDTDFCANCEALPSNRHNHTHPLIKFKVPVRNVSITTMNEDKHGSITRLGDQQPATKSTSTETTPVALSTNAATQVQTVVDMKPIEEAQSKATDKKIEIRDLLTEPVPEKISVNDLLCASKEASPPSVPASNVEKSKTASDLDAHFVRDTIADGTAIGAGLNFVQVWTLRNPGPNAWPAGCSVRHVGGDNMLNIDNTRPFSQAELSEASESNVIGRCVEPGEEIAFRVVMKAPVREGTAISYWRLKTADGTPFGHRLWCDIQVESPSKRSTVSATERSTSPSTSSTIPEASAFPADSSIMTRQERWNQMKLQRLRLLQMAQERMRQEKSTEEIKERTARLHEEALERLRNLTLQSASQKLELEKKLHIQEVRKAAVERLFETRRKEHDAPSTTMQPETTTQSSDAPELLVKQETAELPVEEKPVEAQAESSTMIFPQLEKESPASSTHEAVSAVLAPSEVAVEEHSEQDFFEDAESVEIRSLSSEDEGFLTDEEYDILDASDEDMA